MKQKTGAMLYAVDYQNYQGDPPSASKQHSGANENPSNANACPFSFA